MSRYLNKTKSVSQEYSNMATKKFCPDSSALTGLTSRVDELKNMFENRLNTLEKKMDLLITTCSSILSNCDDPLGGLNHGHVCCAALLLPKIMVIDDFIKNTLLNNDNKNNSNSSGPLVMVPSGKPSVKDPTGGGQVISLNSEQDLPDGSWLGDRNDPKGRVRVNIPPSILIHINERCQTPEKMALTLLDYLFPREVLAISNISGKGKHSKCQLDPLKIFAIRCHLVHKFSISEHDWYRIKQNIDSKCRAVWRKKINGLPLENNKLHFLRSELNQSTDVDSDDCQNSSQALNNSTKSIVGDDQQFTLLQDGQTVKVFMDDEFKELLQTSWADEPASVESLSVDEPGVFTHFLVEQKLLVNGAASPEKSLEDESDLLYSSNSHSGSDFGSDKPDKSRQRQYPVVRSSPNSIQHTPATHRVGISSNFQVKRPKSDMPGFRQKVAGFIQKLANPPDPSSQPPSKSGSYDQKRSPQPRSNDYFIQKYLSGQENGRTEPKIVHGRTPGQLPPSAIGALTKPVLSAMTGPGGGLTTVNKKRRHLSISDPDVRFIDTTDEDSSPGAKDANSNTSNVNCNLLPASGPEFPVPLQKCESTPNATGYTRMSPGDPVAGVVDWDRPTPTAYGKSVSLYERHPVTGVPAGEPIADCFAVIAREESAILVLADGVNWGAKASLAARAAVHGCVDYLNQALYNHRLSSTTDAFVALLRSFNAAHNLILEENGMLTTLTAVLVLPLVAPRRYVACACNVGDSLAYVFSPKYGVREITQGSHDVHRMRDMRDALGALGPVDGTNPELANLTCAMTEVDPGDIVFITSDGVSDNLDPVVGKFTGLNGVVAEQRHKLGLLRTEDLLNNGVSGKGPPVKSARALTDLMIDFVTRLTSAKRHLLEDADLYPASSNPEVNPEVTHRAKRKELSGKLAAIPGKLDHATIVAFNVPS